MAFLVALICSGCVSPRTSPLAKFEQSMVFQPARYPEGNWEPIGLAFEDVHFSAEDGTKLHGWFVPHAAPKAVILFAHGNAGNITYLAHWLRDLHDRHNVAVMTFDYRGYGRSEGSPNEDGVLQDARAARAWLAQRTGQKEQEIVLMGRSLGGGVMVDLAANDGARALILESTFTSLPAVARGQIPLLPAGLVMQNRLNSLAKIKNYHGPLLMSHGDADKLISFQQGRRLFETANEPKRFVAISGGDHNSEQSLEYWQAFDEFLDSLPASRQLAGL
jgi:fermentation-respiration switch protein FrsA (DUF1100 family)